MKDRDFRYFVDQYGIEGARSKFETACYRLINFMYPSSDVYKPKSDGGDKGIDIFVGKLEIEPITVYQCKFFIDKFGKTQTEQIENSFNRIINNNDIKLKEWILCIPINLDTKYFKWWFKWKEEKEDKYPNIRIDLWVRDKIIAKFKDKGLYEEIFDIEEVRAQKKIDFLYKEKLNDIDTKGLFLLLYSLSEKLRDRVENKKEINILQAAIEVIKHFDGLVFYPDSLLSIYPFGIIKEDVSTTQYHEFYQLIEKLDSKETPVILNENYTEEQYKIDKDKLKIFLLQNDITYLFLWNGNIYTNGVRVKRPEDSECDCIWCNYNKLNFNRVNEIINDNQKDIDYEDEFKKASIYFHLGNYKKAHDTYKELSTYFLKEKKYVYYFICFYNLKMLKFEEVNLDEIILGIQKEGVTKEVIQVLSWIKENKFYLTTMIDIYGVLEKVEEGCKSKNRGIEYNKFYGLYSVLSKIQLLQRNHIIPNYHTESNIVEGCLEAFLKLYKIRAAHYDSMYPIFINRILLYVKNTPSLRTIFDDHSSGLIKLQNENYLVDIINNYTDSYTNIQNTKLRNTLLQNIYILLANVEVNEKDLNECIKRIIQFKGKEKNKIVTIIGNTEVLDEFLYFLEKQGNKLNQENLEEIIKFFIQNNHDDYYLDHYDYYLNLIISRAWEFLSNNPYYQATKEFRAIIDKRLKKFILDKKSFERLAYLYNLANREDKGKIKEILTNKLTTSFNFILYQICIFAEIIEFEDGDFLHAFIEKIKQESTWNKRPNDNYMTDSNRFLDEFIHYAYRFNKCLEIVEEQKLHKNIPYYKWLSNPEAFDYETFEPIWLIYYKNEYYFERFKKIPAIKQAIEKSLKNNFNDELSKIYIEYFIA